MVGDIVVRENRIDGVQDDSGSGCGRIFFSSYRNIF